MNGQATTTGAMVASQGRKDWSGIALATGILFLALSFLGIWLGFARGDARPAYGVLIMFSFYLSIGLGMLLLIMLHHLFGAGWSVIPRRQLEHGITIFPWLGLIFIPFLLISYLTAGEDQGFIWKWLNEKAVADDVLYQKKKWWLGETFFLIRYFIYFGGWILIASKLRRCSLQQDEDGDPKWSRAGAKWSAFGIIFTALTLSGASIDWIKALEFHWFSTMYGVWFFSAAMRAALAVTVLACLCQVYKNGPLSGLFKTGHLYDLGCIQLAFTVFWAYISFSQYFLIYNANIPEETFWYVMREQGAWWGVSMGLIFGHFLFSFLFLLFYSNKVKAGPMIFISVWVLFWHLADLYFNILPSKRLDYDLYIAYPFSITIWDVTAFLGIGAICAWSYLRSWKGSQLIPIRDPRITESLQHHGR